MGKKWGSIILSSCCSPATGLPMIRRPQDLRMIVCQMLECRHLVIAAQLTIYKWLKVLPEWLFGFSAGYPCGKIHPVAMDFVTLADCQLNAERLFGGLLSLVCKYHRLICRKCEAAAHVSCGPFPSVAGELMWGCLISINQAILHP